MPLFVTRLACARTGVSAKVTRESAGSRGGNEARFARIGESTNRISGALLSHQVAMRREEVEPSRGRPEEGEGTLSAK